MKIISIATILLLLLTIGLSSCSKKPVIHTSKLSSSQRDNIKSKRTFGELFNKITEIELKQNDSCMIGTIDHLIVTNDGLIVVGDNSNHQIYVFNSEGYYLYKIGRLGGGPGEYRRIADIIEDEEGNILCLDNKLDRVTKYNINGNYLGIYKVGYGFRLAKTSKGGFLVYNYACHPQSDEKIIYSYDTKGDLIGDFGIPFPKSIIDRVPISGGDIAVYEDCIYAVHASEFKVRKMSINGDLIDEFTRNSPVYQPLEPPLTFQHMEKIQSFSFTRSVTVIDPGIVVVTLTRAAPLNKWLELFDVDGIFLNGAIEIPDDIDFSVAQKNNTFYFIKSMVKKVDSEGDIGNYVLAAYKFNN